MLVLHFRVKRSDSIEKQIASVFSYGQLYFFVQALVEMKYRFIYGDHKSYQYNLKQRRFNNVSISLAGGGTFTNYDCFIRIPKQNMKADNEYNDKFCNIHLQWIIPVIFRSGS
jgi:hypothetical protein